MTFEISVTIAWSFWSGASGPQYFRHRSLQFGEIGVPNLKDTFGKGVHGIMCKTMKAQHEK